MKGNKLVVLAGVLLMVATFCGIFLYGRLMNPPAYYVLAAASNIEANTSLVSLGEANFIEVDISSNRAMGNTFVTRTAFIEMQKAGGQFVRSVRQNEPIKYTDISSPANPMASNAVTLGINDPNKVVMTINVEGFAPRGVQQGDYIDIVAVTSYEGKDVYENELANLMSQARKIALAQIESAENIDTSFSFDNLNSNGNSDSFNFESLDSFNSFSFGNEQPVQDQNMFTVSAPSLTAELQEKADLLEEKANALDEKLKSWNDFLDTYGSIDPVELAAQLDGRYYLSPMAKVLVNGAQVMHVGRADDSYTSSVTTLDVLVPREDIEWVAMANEGGVLRVAVLPMNANPSGSGATAGATMQDFIESFADDRDNLTEGTHVTIPSSK